MRSIDFDAGNSLRADFGLDNQITIVGCCSFGSENVEVALKDMYQRWNALEENSLGNELISHL